MVYYLELVSYNMNHKEQQWTASIHRKIISKERFKMAKVKKGQTMIMVGFTGIKLTRVEVAEVTDKGIVVVKRNGEKVIFDKKTLVQTNAKSEKYANRLIEDDPDWEPALNKARKAPKKASKKATKKAAAPVEDDEEDEEDEEEEKPVKKSSKKASKKPAKKAEPEEDEDDEEFDDDDEEL